MKKLFKVVAVAVLSLGFGVAANAQGTAGASSKELGMTASATVYDAINITVETPLNFGQVTKGTKKSVLVTSNTATSNSNTVSLDGVKTGIFKVSAGQGSSVKLEFDLPAVLERKSGTGADLSLDFVKNHADVDTDFAAWSLSNDFSSSTTFVPGSGFNFSGLNNQPLFPASEIYVYIGGTVIAPADLGSGTFSNVITLTATYN